MRRQDRVGAKGRANQSPLTRCGALGFCAVLTFALSSSAKDEPNSELVQMVVNLLSEKDKDLRAVGLDQVRNEAKGTAATKQFAAQLPKLNAAEQVGLLVRWPIAATRPHYRRDRVATDSRDESVRAAAVTAIGSLGSATELPLLAQSTCQWQPPLKKPRRNQPSNDLRGEAVPGEIAAAIKNSPPPICVVLIEVLAERRALSTVGDLLTAATGDDEKVRRAAMVGALAIGFREPPARHVQGRTQSRKRHRARGCRKSGRRRCRRD